MRYEVVKRLISLLAARIKLDKKMDKISNVSISSIDSSQYLQPMRMKFDQDGKRRTWDLLKVHSSVAILLIHRPKKSLIFVRQFRPAIYLAQVPPTLINAPDSPEWRKYPGCLGITYELCAGIVDKDLPLNQIAKEEILEECGFDVPLEKIEKITACRGGVGVTGSVMTIFKAEVDDSMKITEGGGNPAEHERIEVEYVPFDKLEEILYDEDIPKPAAFMYAVTHFIHKELPKLSKSQ